MTSPLIRLSARLIRGAGRREIVRLVVMVLGVTVALVALLIGMAAPRAITSAQSVASARVAVSSPTKTGSDSRLHVQASSQMVGDRPWSRNLVWAPPNGHVPVPPGVARWPAPGQSLVSPALAKLIDAGSGRKLGIESYSGIITSRGVQNPSELISYTMKTPLSTYPDPGVDSFGQTGSVRSGMSPFFLYVEMCLLVGLPALAFFNVVMRLSLASRRKRFHSLVLVGASPRDMAKVFATEMCAIGTVGVCLALACYSSMQASIGSMGILGVTWWPWQGAVSPSLVGGLFAGFLLLVWVIAKRRMQADLSPSRARLPSRWFVAFQWACGAVCVMGFTGLVVITVKGVTSPSREPRSDAGALIIAGLAACAFLGYLGVAGQITRWSAETSAKFLPGAALRLGARSAAFRAPQVGRLMAFVSLAVIAAGISVGFLRGMERNGTGDPGRAVVRFDLDQVPSEQRAQILALPEVPHAYYLTDAAGRSVMVGDCDGVNAFQGGVFQHPGMCAEGQIQRGSGGLGSAGVHGVKLSPKGALIHVPDSPLVDKVMYDVKLPDTYDTEAVKAQTGEVYFVTSRTNGSYDRLVNGIHRLLPTVQIDAGLKDPEAYANYQQQVAATRTGITAALILATLSMLLSCAELRWASERSRNALSALGASARTLRFANLVQFATPTVVGGAIAAIVAILSGWCVASFWGSATMFSADVPLFVGFLYGVSVIIAVIAGWLTGRGEYRRDLMAAE